VTDDVRAMIRDVLLRLYRGELDPKAARAFALLVRHVVRAGR
jgi:hypothetical protein